MQHSSLVLLPPLLPFVGGPMPDLDISIHVLVGLVVDPNAELVHVWSSGHSVSRVELKQVVVQPLHLLQHVPIGGRGWGGRHPGTSRAVVRTAGWSQQRCS